MKLAFIVQRYGREIPGGAETLARQIAERLSRRHQIDVLTTTARDYVSWKNEYPANEEKLRGVRVVRVPVEQERNIEEFNRFSEWIYKNPHSREDELRWLEMQGPVCPKLIEYLKNEHQRYDLLVFFTYLYYPTFYGIQVAPEKSVLLPTAHDEPPLKLGIYKEVFNTANSFIFNTEAEEVLVLQRFEVHRKMRETIGIGMELLDPPDTSVFRRRYHVSNRFLLFAGRIDEGKGCGELFHFFRLFREEHPEFGNLQLLLIGKKGMSIPSSRDIRYLGFLDEDEKLAAMAAANAVVIPSRLESLSIVALEAFAVGTPIIVHGGSRVLVDHCRRANAGLYYTSYEEFEAILEAVLGDKNLGRALGRQGQQYIKDHFGWDRLLAHYELAFRSSARDRRPAVASGHRPGGFRDRERIEAPFSGAPPPERGASREEVRQDVQSAAERRPHSETPEEGLSGQATQAEQAGQAERAGDGHAEPNERTEPEALQPETAEEVERNAPPLGPPNPEEPEESEQSHPLVGDDAHAIEPDERDLFDDQGDDFRERHSYESSDTSKETEDPEDPEGGTGSRDDRA
jgi:glycosyltransferase involved in cell wall biosynthesis